MDEEDKLAIEIAAFFKVPPQSHLGKTKIQRNLKIKMKVYWHYLEVRQFVRRVGRKPIVRGDHVNLPLG